METPTLNPPPPTEETVQTVPGEEVRLGPGTVRFYRFILERLRRGWSLPSYREMATRLGYRSPNSPFRALTQLRDLGLLQTSRDGVGTPRSLRVPGVRFTMEFENTPAGRLARALWETEVPDRPGMDS